MSKVAPGSSHLISLIAPAYNEEEVLDDFYTRITAVFNSNNLAYEIIYINDGSTDDTQGILNRQRNKDDRISIIKLSRNFGKEIAVTAGIDAACGDAVIIIDVDLQDPPEVIMEMIEKWESGYDVVYARRRKRRGESLIKKTTAFAFYRILGKISQIPIPEDCGDFRLLSRRAAHEMQRLRENHRYMKGLYSWIGFPQTAVYYERSPRLAGKSHWGYPKLINFALDGITSFTVAPLRIASFFGILSALIAFFFGIYILSKKLLFGDPVAGYPSLVVLITFIGGIQLLALGVIGEYLGRVFNETKNRPLYIIEESMPSVYSNPEGSIQDQYED